MACFRSIFHSVILIVVAVFFCIQSSSVIAQVVAEDDLKCLRGVKDSLHDPESKLASWNFNNITSGSICTFGFVVCWNDLENRVITLNPTNLGLAGTISSALQFCGSLQSLILSGNSLTGSIPNELCTWTPYLVILDLSNNQLTGEIPDLSKCVFLNTLLLSGNRFSGPIPPGLSRFNSSSFEGNDGLCGKPLNKC
ncbi:hypothetical protein LXL04_006195 [Taraxacum kok-saghyz]